MAGSGVGRHEPGCCRLFDLTVVVAVAAVTAQFAPNIDDGRALAGLVSFLQVFFAVWWAWMNFTWFASSYDTDDVPSSSTRTT
ncbi:hypothetical protein GCM10023195_18710 [Actinoallomurus liliacearum]|uniref:Transmembrane protein n=1 Tax=Actinoallomurus liliacearum TaxID=1080073 RepID=A0ABP8THF6_9ACTN